MSKSQVKKSARLVIITNLPAMGGRVALLQVRGTYNHEKQGPEIFPGACQVSVHGNANDKEEHAYHKTIVQREISEKFGNLVAAMISHEWLSTFLVNGDQSGEAKQTFAMEIAPDFLKYVTLNASTGGIRFVTEEQVKGIQDLANFDETQGVMDRNVIAMFSDEKEAIMQAFEKLKES